MKGWKTWLAAAGTAALGIVDIVNGEVETGVMKIVAALGLVGVGHKLEKGKS